MYLHNFPTRIYRDLAMVFRLVAMISRSFVAISVEKRGASRWNR